MNNFQLYASYHTSAKTPLQTVKVQAKVEMARMESTWSQAPAKDKVVMAIKLVITVPHLSIHTHLFLSFVVFIIQLYSPGVGVGEGIFHWPENEGSIVHQESCQRSRDCEEKIPTRVRTLALQKNLVQGKDAGLKFFLVNCS